MKIRALLLGALLRSERQVYDKAIILQTNEIKLVAKEGRGGSGNQAWALGRGGRRLAKTLIFTYCKCWAYKTFPHTAAERARQTPPCQNEAVDRSVEAAERRWLPAAPVHAPWARRHWPMAPGLAAQWHRFTPTSLLRPGLALGFFFFLFSKLEWKVSKLLGCCLRDTPGARLLSDTGVQPANKPSRKPLSWGEEEGSAKEAGAGLGGPLARLCPAKPPGRQSRSPARYKHADVGR